MIPKKVSDMKSPLFLPSPSVLSSLAGLLLAACMWNAQAQPASGPSATGSAGTQAAAANPAFPRRLPTNDELFDWAEGSFPVLFPTHAATQAAPPFAFRHYPSTSTYLGTANNEVFVVGPVTSGSLVKAGNVPDFLCVAVKDNCYLSARKLTGLSNLDAKPDMPPQRIADLYWQKSTKRRANTRENTWSSYSYGDFKGDGRLGIFMASEIYLTTEPLSQARPGQFEFFSQDAEGNFFSDSTLYSGTQGCIHPRKVITADFNGDGKPDVFVACHGYDAPPFPGEDSFIFLSSPSGQYTAKAFPQGAGFTHSVSSGDVDKNGTIDMVMADPRFGGRIFLNDGKGNFTPRPLPLPHKDGEWGYDITEFVDIDGDGNLDIWAARPEIYGNFALFLMGDGTADFSMQRTRTFPPMPAAPIPLDFVQVDLNQDGKKDLIVVRTMSSPFYQGIGVQVLQNTGSAFVVTGERLGGSTAPLLPFLPWIRYYGGKVISDDQGNAFSVDLPTTLLPK